jgi:hypothetical protein
MWTTPDGRQIDLNNPTVVAEEIDHLIQVTEQDYISYNNKQVASGKPAKDFSKLLKSQRDVLVHAFNYLRDAIIAPSTVVDKKATAEEELNRYYYAYDTGALVPKTVHEEFKLYENMWESADETAKLQESASSIDEEQLYAEVQTTVDSCLQRLKLARYCEDSYDNSYDDGAAMQYELLWNFSKVPNQTKLESALNAALLGICTNYGVDISVSVDDEVLADEGYVNLLVAYEIPYGTAGDLTEASDSKYYSSKKTFGRKTYYIDNDKDLRAWVNANIDFQRKRYPDRYENHSNNYRLISSVFNNLIKTEKDAGAPLEFLRRLEVLRDTYYNEYEDTLPGYTGGSYSNNRKTDIAIKTAAKTCVENFIKDLRKANNNGGSRLSTHLHWEEDPTIISKFNAIEEELVLFGKFLLSAPGGDAQ